MAYGDTVDFSNVVAKHETEAAILCVVDGKEVWIPKSQIDDSSEVKEDGDEGTLVVSEWIAEQKDLI